MKVGIIGAGFTGLSAAYYLLEKKHEVYLFERDEVPGGLALGFTRKEWGWTPNWDMDKMTDDMLKNLRIKLGID